MTQETLEKIKAAKESSDRGRWVLLAMQVACIVVFVAAWHELPEDWTFTRLQTAQAAVWLLDCGPNHPEQVLDPTKATDSAGRPHENCHYMGSDGKPTINPFSDQELKSGRKFLAEWKLSPSEARKQLDELQNSLVERAMNVSVPFLGISFDINDLSLLGGAAFLLLLVWFYYSLNREEINISDLFKNVSDQELVETYQLISMTQVLTIPPRLDERKRRKWEGVASLLFFTPILVQGFVLGLDGRTLIRGIIINQSFTRTEFAIGLILFLIMCIITLECRGRSKALYDSWSKARDSARKLMSPPPDPPGAAGAAGGSRGATSPRN